MSSQQKQRNDLGNKKIRNLTQNKMSLVKEFIETRNVEIPKDFKQLAKIMDVYASMMVELERERVKQEILEIMGESIGKSE